jgi:signal peptide peptidase SppA
MLHTASPLLNDRSWLRGHPWALHLEAFDQAPSRRPTTTPPSSVGVIQLLGMLWHRPTLLSALAGGTVLTDVRRWLALFVASPAVRAIVLDVDSPGGSVHGASETWQAIRAADQVKPVIAVVSGCGASAAYWLASGARRILASPSAEVGSIGVYGVHADKTALYTAKGITHTVIASGAKKVEALDIAPLTDDAKAALQRRVDAAYGRFVADVAAGRRTTVEAVKRGFGEGRLLAAEDALAAGLVDGIQTIDATVDRLHRQNELHALSPLPTENAHDQLRRAEIATLSKMWRGKTR